MLLQLDPGEVSEHPPRLGRAPFALASRDSSGEESDQIKSVNYTKVTIQRHTRNDRQKRWRTLHQSPVATMTNAPDRVAQSSTSIAALEVGGLEWVSLG